MAKRPPKKRRGPRPPRSPRQQSAGRGNVQQQVAQLQEQMLKAQEALKDEEVTATAGGGMVTVTANGQQEILAIAIDPEVLDPEDVEIVQDMVLAAVNEALEKSRNLASERMGAFTGGIDIPGLM